MKLLTPISASLFVVAFSAPVASAAVIMDWDASNWSGVAGEGWVDSVGGVEAVAGAGEPVKSATTINGINVDVINFTSDSFDVNVLDHPLVGLSEFTISLVFSSASAGAASENNFYQWNGMVGTELPAAGVGDWAVGFMEGGLVAGGAALGPADVGTPSISTAQNTGFRTVSFVVDDNGNGTHSQYLYLDGVLQNSDLDIAYGGGSSVVAASDFAIGARRNGDNGFFDGAIARLQFEDTALTPAEIAALHSTYLNEAIPEPTVSLMALLSGLGFLMRRRRA